MASVMQALPEKSVQPPPAPKLSVRDLNFYYGSFHAIKRVNMEIPRSA